MFFDDPCYNEARAWGIGSQEVPAAWRNDCRTDIQPVRETVRVAKELFAIRFSSLERVICLETRGEVVP